ncbi:MAG TPA: hypothetical protein VEQ60_24825 [Longimicrobium sp.]|nr:hypothetical protein [Longimicrobium sp.]
MRSRREGPSFEEMAIERDRELERQRAAAEGDPPSEFRYDFSQPLPGTLVARETAALSWGLEAAAAPSEYPSLVERLLSRIWHVMYTLGEQKQEIVRLRENTRQVLARLVTA